MNYVLKTNWKAFCDIGYPDITDHCFSVSFFLSPPPPLPHPGQLDDVVIAQQGVVTQTHEKLMGSPSVQAWVQTLDLPLRN